MVRRPKKLPPLLCPACSSKLDSGRIKKDGTRRWRCKHCRLYATVGLDAAKNPKGSYSQRLQDKIEAAMQLIVMRLPMRVTELAARLGVTRSTIYEHCRESLAMHIWDGKVYKGTAGESGHRYREEH